MSSDTPSLITDYLQLSQQYVCKYGPNTVLLMQVGAFFEMYGLKKADELINDVCHLCQLNTSDKKICVGQDSVVMAGFRDYTLDKYISKLTDGGYTAVVYVQEKNGKSITRVLHAIYSPGTYVSCDTDSSPQITNNIMCIWLEVSKPFRGNRENLIYGISVVNIFTGKSQLFEYECPYYMNPTTFDEMERCVSVFSPSEVIVVSSLEQSIVNTILQYAGVQCSSIHRINSMSEKAVNCSKQIYIRHIISKFFGEESYAICTEFNNYTLATQSFCYLSDFIQEHNPGLVNKISIPHFNNMSTRMVLANHTLKQLNMISENGQNTCVSVFLNKCRSPMGRRLFNHQITNPTFEENWLNIEYDAIELFLQNYDLVEAFRRELAYIKDIEKILRQLVLRKLYPTSIYHLYNSIRTIQQINTIVKDTPNICDYLTERNCDSYTYIDTICIGLIDFLESNLNVDLCKNIQSLQSFEQNIIRPGISRELDDMIQTQNTNVAILNGVQEYFNRRLAKDKNDTTEYVKKHETEKSCVSLQLTKKRASVLKSALSTDNSTVDILGTTIKFSDVKFVSVSNNADEISIPILNTITNDIYKLNHKIDEQITIVYNQILTNLENIWYSNIDVLGKYIARVDVIQSKAYVSKTYNYCKPVIQHDASKSFVDSDGLRHCLIEHIQTNELYVTNDLHIGCNSRDGILLYGTNAVGKTSLIRALGISVILAQCGMYVPCSRFVYKPYTAIYSRILGNDNLFKGLSTFAVEMSELRVILKMADSNSLVLGDEVCSGTETESALSIFVTALMQLYNKKVSFIFATHFHEIIKFDEIQQLNTMVLAHMTVTFDRENDCLIYDRKLKMGPGNRMYGLEVCKSLYLEDDFLTKAYEIRNKYFPDNRGELSHNTTIYNAKKVRGFCEMCKEEIADETHHIFQQKDASKDGFIESFHKNHPANLMSVCEKCHDSIHREPSAQLVRKKTTKGYKIQKQNNKIT
jgi:DNA mismatch repair protein MutS